MSDGWVIGLARFLITMVHMRPILMDGILLDRFLRLPAFWPPAPPLLQSSSGPRRHVMPTAQSSPVRDRHRDRDKDIS